MQILMQLKSLKPHDDKYEGWGGGIDRLRRGQPRTIAGRERRALSGAVNLGATKTNG